MYLYTLFKYRVSVFHGEVIWVVYCLCVEYTSLRGFKSSFPEPLHPPTVFSQSITWRGDANYWAKGDHSGCYVCPWQRVTMKLLHLPIRLSVLPEFRSQNLERKLGTDHIQMQNPLVPDILWFLGLLIDNVPKKLMELNSSFQKLLKASREKKAKQIAFVVIGESHLVEDW